MTDAIYYRDLPAIPEDERVSIPESFSQTFLAKFANCPRSAYLMRKHRGGPASASMIRGSLFHEAVEELSHFLIANDELVVPPEIARDVLRDVHARHPEWVLPPAEVDAVRLMVYNWAEHTRIDPEQVFGIEQMWRHELADGSVIRGKVDIVRLAEGMARTTDYKTSLAMKSEEEWSHDFQSIFYDVLLAYGETDDGTVLPVGIEMFESTVEYPRYVFDDGIGHRTSYRDRVDLRDHYGYLVDLVDKVKYAFDTGKFPAIPGAHCNECPAATECPILKSLRDNAEPIESDEDARRQAEDRDFHQSASRRLSRDLRAWVNEHGVLEYGKNRELALVSSESRTVDWEALPAAIELSVSTGEPFESERYVRYTTGTRLVARKRSG